MIAQHLLARVASVALTLVLGSVAVAGQQFVVPLMNQTTSDSFGFDMVPQNAGPLLSTRLSR